MLGIEPRSSIVTEDFLTVRGLVIGSDRIALIPRLLLEVPGVHDGLTAHPCPVRIDPLAQAMWWHPIKTDAPEHMFLRTTIELAALQVAVSSP